MGGQRWTGRLGGAMAALVAAAFLWWMWRPQPLVVDLGTVARAALRATVDEEGETRVRDRFVVAAPITGRLLRIDLDEGDAVEAGAVVARLEPSPLDARNRVQAQARLEAARADRSAAAARVARSAAALEQAHRDDDRSRRLRESGVLSAEEFERRRLDLTTLARELDAAKFQEDAARHEVDAAEATLLAAGVDTKTLARIAAQPGAALPAPAAGEDPPPVGVTSPGPGRVLRVHEESERVVPAGTPLLTVGNPQALEIVTDVLSTDAVKIAVGQRMLIEDWGGDAPLEGRVRRVEPSAFTKVSALGVEEQRVNVVADVANPPPSLGDGFRVEARVVVWEGQDILQAPSSAFFRHGGRWAVFIVEDGVAHRRDVELGHRGDFAVEVSDGLREGEVVVLSPNDRVEDGVRVQGR